MSETSSAETVGPSPATPAERRREATDDRRAAIATAARELIVEKGVEGLRTRDIAERVGINVATLHYHVPTKEALIALVADSLRQEFLEQHVTRPRAHLGIEERMNLEFVDFRETIEERPDMLLVLSELSERARRDERIAACILPMKRRWRQGIEDMITEGMAAGIYRADLDPEAAALMITGALVSFSRGRCTDLDAYERLVAELKRSIQK